ncbi:MAG TPA: ribosome-associated translation inhibitor RaiA [Thermoanaerobaculia bacterium]|nr:ribosome-associated translation inhibitor RaiA [Thermoanaerobaculia bacterium]
MAVECTGRNVSVDSSLKDLAEERVQRLERHLGGPTDVRVVLSHEKHRFGAEIIAIRGRRRWTAQEQTGDPRAALALAFEKIDAQAMRDTEKRRDRKHQKDSRTGTRRLRAAGPAPTPVRRSPKAGSRVVRGRVAPVKPMGVDEAALAMESSGQEVLVFRDASSEKVSVLYRRRDGDLGLIVPEC